MDEQLAEMDGARRAINLKQLGKRGGPQGGWPVCCVPPVYCTPRHVSTCGGLLKAQEATFT